MAVATDRAAARPVRMLVVSSDTYPPTRVDVTVLFGEELSSRGHQVDWILQSEKECDRPFVQPWGNGNVYVGATDLGNRLFSRIRKHARGILHDLRLFSLMRSGRYDLIEVKDKFLSGLFAIVAAKLFGKRFIYWLSYPFPEEYLHRAKDGTARYPFLYVIRGYTFKVLLYKVLLPGADHIFVQSEQMLHEVAREGIPARKMTAVPMGVRAVGNAPVDATVPVPRTVIPEGERCFLYLGALTKVRRMDFLIRVLARVREQMPDVKLYLVGRGDFESDEKILTDEAQRLGVTSAVVFTGQLPQAQALQYVLDADVCVSPLFPTPIFNVASPTKLVEYMSMGKAVVANDHPDQRLVIEGSGAGYCVAYEEQAFADAVVKILNDPAGARIMGKRGREYVSANRSYATIATMVERELVRVAFDGAK